LADLEFDAANADGDAILSAAEAQVCGSAETLRRFDLRREAEVQAVLAALGI
jgi:hypothetical protein